MGNSSDGRGRAPHPRNAARIRQRDRQQRGLSHHVVRTGKCCDGRAAARLARRGQPWAHGPRGCTPCIWGGACGGDNAPPRAHVGATATRAAEQWAYLAPEIGIHCVLHAKIRVLAVRRLAAPFERVGVCRDWHGVCQDWQAPTAPFSTQVRHSPKHQPIPSKLCVRGTLLVRAMVA